jgi:hypothetical protein
MRHRSIQGLPVAVLLLCLPVNTFAQRELHWDALSVAANLDADGILHVAETHAMVSLCCSSRSTEGTVRFDRDEDRRGLAS